MMLKNDLLKGASVYLMRYLIWLIVGTSIFAAYPLSAQQGYLLSGRISDEYGNPLVGVSIKVQRIGHSVYLSDDKGEFELLVYSDDALSFSYVGYERVEVSNLRGRRNLNIELTTKVEHLEELTIVAELTRNILVEPTDIEVVGNWVHIRPRITIPEGLFRHYSRLVIQPQMVNVTRGVHTLMRPIVQEGRQFRAVQKRIYGFDYSKDPLSCYAQLNDDPMAKGRVVYHDSAFVDDPSQDYRCDIEIYLYHTDPRRNVYHDTLTIARGTVYPMRFFHYEPAAASLKDSDYNQPTPEMQYLDDKGSLRLHFRVGSMTVDYSLADNEAQIEAARMKMRAIIDDPTMKMQSVAMCGYASPEGGYQQNKRLAHQRMVSAKREVLRVIPRELLADLYTEDSSAVATWSDVVALMQADGDEEAERVASLVAQYAGDRDRQSHEILRLPQIGALIRDKYLPRLRTINYLYTYALERVLTDDEIARLYDAGEILTKYEYWRLMHSPSNSDRLEEIARRAIAHHKEYLYPAALLAQLLLEQDRADAQLLERFAIKGAPVSVLVNHTVALMNNGYFQKAHETMSYIPPGECPEVLNAMLSARRGEYEEALTYYAAHGGLNEVLLLLAVKRDKEAYEAALMLDRSLALSHYVISMCANRLVGTAYDDGLMVMVAIDELEVALEMAPSLREIAELDADVKDLLPQ